MQARLVGSLGSTRPPPPLPLPPVPNFPYWGISCIHMLPRVEHPSCCQTPALAALMAHIDHTPVRFSPFLQLRKFLSLFTGEYIYRKLKWEWREASEEDDGVEDEEEEGESTTCIAAN